MGLIDTDLVVNDTLGQSRPKDLANLYAETAPSDKRRSGLKSLQTVEVLRAL